VWYDTVVSKVHLYVCNAVLAFHATCWYGYSPTILQYSLDKKLYILLWLLFFDRERFPCNAYVKT